MRSGYVTAPCNNGKDRAQAVDAAHQVGSHRHTDRHRGHVVSIEIKQMVLSRV